MKIVLAITGPTGSGKSTVAQQLAQQINKCVNIDADHVKHFIVNGFIYDDSPEGTRQWELLGKNIGILASNFQNDGYQVVINGYINEPAWKQIATYIELTHKILLLPDLDVVKNRDKGRLANVAMGEEAVSAHHNYFSTSDFYKDFILLDTTNQSAPETTAKIKNIISL